MIPEAARISRRQWAALAATGVLAAGGGAWWSARGGDLPAGQDGPLPEPVRSLDGRTWSNADLAGQPVLLNFWAPWCGPCVKEMPELDAFSRSQAARGMKVLGLAIDEAPAVQQFLKTHPVGFPIAVLGYGGLQWVRRFSGEANSALPFSAVFDRRHRLVQRKFGPTSAQELASWAQKL